MAVGRNKFKRLRGSKGHGPIIVSREDMANLARLERLPLKTIRVGKNVTRRVPTPPGSDRPHGAYRKAVRRAFAKHALGE